MTPETLCGRVRQPDARDMVALLRDAYARADPSCILFHVPWAMEMSGIEWGRWIRASDAVGQLVDQGVPLSAILRFLDRWLHHDAILRGDGDPAGQDNLNTPPSRAR